MRTGRILVVEDEGIVGLELQQRLRGLGHTVVGIADHGLRAIELAEQHAPDLALMDMRLPGELDGAHTASILRERFNLPSIFLTAYSDDETVERVQHVQPYGYLLKPYDERLLHVTVQQALYRLLAEKSRKLVEDERRRAEKAEAVAKLAAGVVHDMNNLLSSVRCNAYLIETHQQMPDDVLEAASDITSAVVRGSTLLGELVHLAREQRDTTIAHQVASLTMEKARGEAEAARAAAALSNRGQAALGTVLVVDDDAIVRRAVAKSLTSWGCHVLSAPDASAAVVMAEHQPIDLMITDVILPEQSGYDLALQLWKLRPDARVMYMSGHTPDMLEQRYGGTRDWLQTFLQKPFSIDALKHMVKRALVLQQSAH